MKSKKQIKKPSQKLKPIPVNPSPNSQGSVKKRVKRRQAEPNETKQCQRRQTESNSAKRRQTKPSSAKRSQTKPSSAKRNHTKQISKSGFRFAKCKTGSSPAKTALLEPVTENKPILNNSAEPAPVMCINYSLCSNYRLFCRRFLRELFH